MNKIIRLIDYILSLVFIPFYVLIIILFYRTKDFSAIQKKKIVFIVREHEDISSHYTSYDYSKLIYDVDCAYSTAFVCANSKHQKVKRFSKKIIGVDLLCKELFSILKKYLIFTNQRFMNLHRFFRTLIFIKKYQPTAIVTMFPSNVNVRTLLVKLTYPYIKLVVDVRGNLEIIKHFNPFPAFCYFYSKSYLIALIQTLFDNLISYLIMSNADLIKGSNINNMNSGISHGGQLDKTRLVRIKIDERFYKLSKTIDIEHLKVQILTSKRIVIWCRLSPEKMIFELVQAFHSFLKKSRDISLVIMGDGPEYSKINNYIQSNKLSEYIYLKGYCSKEQICSIAKTSFLTIITIGGSSLVEAALLGVPIICFEIEWHSEIIRENETGYLVPFPNYQKLIQKIDSINQEREKAFNNAINCLNLVQNTFDNEKIKNIDEELMHSILYNQKV